MLWARSVWPAGKGRRQDDTITRARDLSTVPQGYSGCGSIGLCVRLDHLHSEFRIFEGPDRDRVNIRIRVRIRRRLNICQTVGITRLGKYFRWRRFYNLRRTECSAAEDTGPTIESDPYSNYSY